MRKTKQLSFAFLEVNAARGFGGGLQKSHPKIKRPVSRTRAMHLVVRSSHAKGDRSLLRKARRVVAIVMRQGKLSGVKLYRFANAGNHLHLIVRPESRESYNKFIRATLGLIAREILGAQKSCGRGLKFWDARPFTRVLEWGRDYSLCAKYVLLNTLEAIGFSDHKNRNPAKKKFWPSG